MFEFPWSIVKCSVDLIVHAISATENFTLNDMLLTQSSFRVPPKEEFDVIDCCVIVVSRGQSFIFVEFEKKVLHIFPSSDILLHKTVKKKISILAEHYIDKFDCDRAEAVLDVLKLTDTLKNTGQPHVDL